MCIGWRSSRDTAYSLWELGFFFLALVFLCTYPLLRSRLLRVPPLRRVTFFKRQKGNPKRFAPTYGPRRLGFLRSRIDPGAAATVCFAAPPSAVYDCVVRSLRSHARINPCAQPSDVAGDARSRARELTLIVEWLEAPHGSRFSVDSPLTPALSRGRGGRSLGFSNFVFDSVLHVGIAFAFPAVSSLSLRERARVRVGFFCLK